VSTGGEGVSLQSMNKSSSAREPLGMNAQTFYLLIFLQCSCHITSSVNAVKETRISLIVASEKHPLVLYSHPQPGF